MTDSIATIDAFFRAYDDHDVDTMVALCAADASARYLPYGRDSLMPVRGGIEHIWRGFARAVPDFTMEIVEILPAEGDAVVVQAMLGGTMPASVPGIAEKGELARFPHAFIFRLNADAKISRIDCYWDNVGTSFLKASSL